MRIIPYLLLSTTFHPLKQGYYNGRDSQQGICILCEVVALDNLHRYLFTISVESTLCVTVVAINCHWLTPIVPAGLATLPLSAPFAEISKRIAPGPVLMKSRIKPPFQYHTPLEMIMSPPPGAAGFNPTSHHTSIRVFSKCTN